MKKWNFRRIFMLQKATIDKGYDLHGGVYLSIRNCLFSARSLWAWNPFYVTQHGDTSPSQGLHSGPCRDHFRENACFKTMGRSCVPETQSGTQTYNHKGWSPQPNGLSYHTSHEMIYIGLYYYTVVFQTLSAWNLRQLAVSWVDGNLQVNAMGAKYSCYRQQAYSSGQIWAPHIACHRGRFQTYIPSKENIMLFALINILKHTGWRSSQNSDKGPSF